MRDEFSEQRYTRKASFGFCRIAGPRLIDISFGPHIIVGNVGAFAHQQVDDGEKQREYLASASHKMNQTISVCIISGAEAHRLETCLASVDGLADEVIVVVDDRANDGTADVARRRGGKVFIEQWKGHIGQKNSAAEKASGEWILSLDADEALSDTLREEISRVVRDGGGFFSAYSFPRCSEYLGRWIRHGDWYPDRQTRLWRRGAAKWGGTDPHDKLHVEGKTGRLQGDLLHYSMTGFDHQISKTIVYADEFVRQSEAQARKISMVDLWFRPAYRFFRGYILRLGFLDGWQGYSIAWMTAFYTFLRYAKAKEAQETAGLSERATDRGPSL